MFCARFVPPSPAEVPFKVAFSNYLQFPMVPPAKLPSKITFKSTFKVTLQLYSKINFKVNKFIVKVLSKNKRAKNPLSSSVNNLLHDIKICGICYYEMTDQVFNCKEGHIICKQCYTKVNRCPFCKDKTLVRNRIVEKLIHETIGNQTRTK